MTKMLITICFAFGFCVSTLIAQDNSGQSSSQGNQSGSQASQSNQGSQGSQSASTSNSGQGQKVSGNVSSDGKTFTSNGKSYTVDNPNALKGSEGQDVTVLIGVDPDGHTIHIIQLVPNQ